MNNKTLLIAFIVLLGIFAVSKMNSGKKKRSFDPEIVKIDTAIVHRIIFHPKADEGKAVTLERTDKNTWMISKDQRRVAAQGNPVKGMLGAMNQIKASRIIAKSKERWKEYEVGEENGNQVRVLDASGNELADFIVGRFNFNQQTRSATSYIRLNDDEDIYAVDGFLNMSFGQGFDSYRDSRLIQVNRDDLTAINMTTESGVFSFSRNTTNEWVDNNGTVMDSTAAVSYLNKFTSVNGQAFADDVDPAILGNPVRSLNIAANNRVGGAIKVDCYLSTNSSMPFLIKSSMNDAWFTSDSSGLYQTLFVQP